MKYKVLLTGNNNSAIDDFFLHMQDNFEALTTSNRYEDIVRHLQIFAPDVFIYCVYNEARDDFSKMLPLRNLLSREKIPFILIGTKEDCEEFEKVVFNITDLVLQKPLTASRIQEKILEFLKERQTSDEQSASMQQEEPLSEAVGQKPETDLDALLDLGETEEPETIQNQVRKHILVIDDDFLMLKVIKGHLHADYDVATAVSGKVAFRFLEKKKTDLILLDYKMPEEDGPAVLEKLRANEETKDIPVVFLTGISEKEKIQKALVMKPQGYLLKPIERDKLLETIKKVIG